MVKNSHEDLGRSVVLILLAVVLVVITRNAWLSDDAFITLRTIDNFVHGFGPVYNLGERVQAFTHPLWMALVSLFYFFTREAYYTLLAVSLLCSASAIVLVAFPLAASRWHAALALGLLALSQSFVDFSSSGLENPLTHLLLAIFAVLYLGHVGGDQRSLLKLALVAALGILNRMDTALLFFPPLLHAALLSSRWRSWRGPGWRGHHAWQTLQPLILGMAPFAAWELFSLFYYGFPFPNTAYAKLGSGIPRIDLVEQGFYYYLDSLARDPLTLIVIFGGLAVVLSEGILSEGILSEGMHRQPRSLVLASGIVLYLAYVFWIGGDFMSGRFFSAVFFLAVILLSRASFSRTSIVAILAICLAVFLALPKRDDGGAIGAGGVVDEKAYYSGLTALLESSRDARILSIPSPWEGFDAEEKPAVRLEGAIGMVGYSEGPGVHLVDFLGLTDPLLARLPTQDVFHWRIGHFERKQPIGYIETLRSGVNKIEDPGVATYYEHLSRVVRGELFSWQRIRTLVAFNLGRYDALINREFYNKPYSYEVDQARFGRIKPEGSPWGEASNLRLAPRNGVLVRLDHPSHCRSLALGLGGGARYALTYYRDEEPMADYNADQRKIVKRPVPFVGQEGIRKRAIAVPENVATKGFDALLIVPYDANRSDRFILGYVRLCE